MINSLNEMTNSATFFTVLCFRFSSLFVPLFLYFLLVSVSPFFLFTAWSIVPIEQWIVIRHLDDHLFSDWFIHWIFTMVLVAPVTTTSASQRTAPRFYLSIARRITVPNDPGVIQTLPERVTTGPGAYLRIKQKHTEHQPVARWLLLSVRARHVSVHRCFLHLPSSILIESMFTRCLSACHAGANWYGASIRSNWELPSRRKSRRW